MIYTRKLKKNILKENSSIKEVINVLNKSRYKICIIIGKKNKTIGIYTDEDLRRNLIKQESFNDLAKTNCNRKFIFCFNTDNDQKINKLFKKFFWINSLVVINKKKQLIGIIDKLYIDKIIAIETRKIDNWCKSHYINTDLFVRFLETMETTPLATLPVS